MTEMPSENLYELTRLAMQEGRTALAEQQITGETSPLAGLINQLLLENHTLRHDHQRAVEYIRAKINQLLMVIGTVPLRAEELTEEHLIDLDPLGIVTQSFARILEHSRETNRKLALARDEIQAIFQSVGGSLLVLDEKKRILSFNENFRASFCPDREDIIGRGCHEIICKRESPPADFCVLQKLQKTGCGCTMSHWPFGDRHLRVVATPIKDSAGAIIRTVLLYVDITELIETKSELTGEKERLATTLESIAEGVIATDPKGQVTLMNRIAEELTGWDADQAIGKSIGEVLLIGDQEPLVNGEDFFLDILQRQVPVERLENTTLTARSGNVLSVYLSAAPIRQPDQSVTGAIIVFRDISGEERIKEELAKAAKLESIGLFAGGIAHDFNNLLTAILGNISLARARIEPNNAGLSGLLHETEKSSNRAKGSDPAAADICPGRRPDHQEADLLADLIMDSARSPCAAPRSVSISVRSPMTSGRSKSTRGRSAQVIQNLVINAAQAMPEGGLAQDSVDKS